MTTAKSTAFQLLYGILLVGGGLVAATLLALSLGAANLDIAEIIQTVLGRGSAQNEFILLHLRIPRIFAAAVVGAALAGSGAIYQALLRNPLADPFILGISGGAAVGAVAVITLIGSDAVLGTSIGAFAGSLGAMALVYTAARRNGSVNPQTLLLVGIIANAFFSALLLLLMAIADEGGLMRASQWMMGNVRSASLGAIGYLLPLVLLAAVMVMLEARSIHLLQLGSETAWHLGVNVRRIEVRMFIAASLLTAAAVTLAGLIGFVGIIIPHILRRLFGSDFRVIFPLSLLGGALLLIVSDTAARTIIAPTELPVGIVTAMLGGPFFMFILRRNA